MRIINLIENTEGANGCAFAHGLSFYIETASHKALVDLGPSEETLANASKLGIELSNVDTVILSHGHYDHSGGIMSFSKINDSAKIYMQKTAVEDRASTRRDINHFHGNIFGEKNSVFFTIFGIWGRTLRGRGKKQRKQH